MFTISALCLVAVTSAQAGCLNVNDYVCFMNRFAAGDAYSDCDRDGLHTVNDYLCFMNAFAQGRAIADCDGSCWSQAGSGPCCH